MRKGVLPLGTMLFALPFAHASPVARGDLNEDLLIDCADLLRLAAHLSGEAPLAAEILACADLTGEGDVDLLDYDGLVQLLLGQRESTACPVPTPSPSATASPSATPIGSATASSSPTPTPTVSPSASATATVTPSPTPAGPEITSVFVGAVSVYNGAHNQLIDEFTLLDGVSVHNVERLQLNDEFALLDGISLFNGFTPALHYGQVDGLVVSVENTASLRSHRVPNPSTSNRPRAIGVEP